MRFRLMIVEAMLLDNLLVRLGSLFAAADPLLDHSNAPGLGEREECVQSTLAHAL